MAYLIDGNNFLGYTSPSSLRDSRTKYNLVLKLLVFQLFKRTRVILVFDGSPDLNLTSRVLRNKRFSLLYPPSGENADYKIKEIISKQTDLRRFYVVSSDHDIQNFAKAKGAKTLGCEDFNRELRKVLKEHKAALEEEKHVSLPSSLEINHWLEIFKKKNE